MRQKRLILTLSLGALCVLPFQNCGKGFDASKISQSSTQCTEHLKSEAQKMKWTTHDFRCDDFADYRCERRVFSPDVENMTHTLRECVGENVCVDVDVRQFNTAAALDADSAPEFNPGGEYNREEVRCSHRWRYQNQPIFVGDRGNLAESLSAAMAACEQALAQE